MFKKKKKKTYIAKCIVNFCADHEEIVVVRATNSDAARIKVHEKLKNNGFFHAHIISCKEME